MFSSKELADVLESAIEEFVKRAFVSGFRIVMLICASLSVASAGVAWLMIQQDGATT